ncbi:hypothetical protein CJ030_MR3G009405 [Morella rubra]|uniref:Uncharacterized protein n=1 Tax=Morella rubra TaxID=262757 RepID=A0A6A1W674_9ROSI|nr:hypothetical protein CJ030_MR3G009405 [Morella rubra]
MAWLLIPYPDFELLSAWSIPSSPTPLPTLLSICLSLTQVFVTSWNRTLTPPGLELMLSSSCSHRLTHRPFLTQIPKLRYVCCAGYMPCSGRCGESQCPELCLCTEVFCCFGNSVASTRFMLQDQFNLQTTALLYLLSPSLSNQRIAAHFLCFIILQMFLTRHVLYAGIHVLPPTTCLYIFHNSLLKWK